MSSAHALAGNSSSDPLLSSEESSASPRPSNKSWINAIAQRPSRLRSGYFLHLLCFALHFLLITIHGILFVVRAHGWERRVRAVTDREITILSITKTIISQTFAIVFLALLLFVTQKLALRHSLNRSTVLATHDKHIAWIGLGSALQSLWNQFSVVSSPIGVANITLYLTLTAALKITTPALFEVVPFNDTTYLSVGSTLSNPPLLSAEGLNTSDTFNHLVASALSMAPFVNNKNGFPALGLHGNMLYDVIDENQGYGDVKVNAHQVNVTCGAVNVSSDTAHLNKGEKEIDIDRDSDAGIWMFQDNDLNEGFYFLPAVAQNVLYFTDVDVGIFFASFEVVDSSGSSGSQQVLRPPMNTIMASKIRSFWPNGTIDTLLNETNIQMYNLTDFYKANVTAVTLLGCQPQLSVTETSVNAQTRIPTVPPNRKTHSTWNFRNVTFDDMDFSWNSLFKSADSRNESATSLCDDGSTPYHFGTSQARPGEPVFVPQKCIYLSQSVKYLMDLLNVSAAADLFSPQNTVGTTSQKNPVPAKVTLHDFENAIEDYTAAMLWSVTHINGSTLRGQANLTAFQVVSHLQLSLIPLSAGLGCSVALLILMPFIIGLKWDDGGNSINTLGVLQILWLARRNPDFKSTSETVSEIEKSSTERLRRVVDTSSRRSAYRHRDTELEHRKPSSLGSRSSFISTDYKD